ncbi:hypothetical protein [Methylobacterium soli]|uniref:Uncharacterized protein n=1 Tax=Methylobacterium soli TaxID=553447 RepID=A0A6L3SYN1_9HYPH|nr:hypothetical protein [Methylobacterium soli]KAB1078377.1 hypothetical protein F6X53_14915 [Methylobacterium soli]GJE45880.1 hypothetical protein AEGHOMDF_5080 [Methylobacterium soli]
MGKYDVLLKSLGLKPKAKKPRVALLVKSRTPKPEEKPKKWLPRDINELRPLLDDAVIGGKITGTHARDICHQLTAGKKLPDDLAVMLLAVLGGERE